VRRAPSAKRPPPFRRRRTTKKPQLQRQSQPRRNQLTDPGAEPNAWAETNARRIVDLVAQAPVGSPELARIVRSIDGLGEREIRATAAIAARFTDRPVRQIESILSDGAPLARHIREVKLLAADISRLSSATSAADMRRIAEQIENRQDDIRALAQELQDDLASISADNGQLAQEAKALHLQLRTLNRFTTLLARVDDLLMAYIDEMRSGTPDAAHRMEVDLMFVVRQRHRDLLMQLAVATQAHAAVERLEHSNLEVLRAMRQAANLMLTALQTSGLAVHAIEMDGALDRQTRGAELLASLDDVEIQRRASLSHIKRGDRKGG
jgi:hypothetical protein